MIEKEKLLELLGSNDLEFPKEIETIRLGMSEIQIKTFVMNQVEFPTDFAQYHQAKFEIWNRLMTLADFYFDFREKQIQMEKTDSELSANHLDKFERQLKELEKEKLTFRFLSLRKQAREKAKELKFFADIYRKFRRFDDLSEQELQELEAETWNRKIERNPRIFKERYDLEGLMLPGSKSARESLGHE